MKRTKDKGITRRQMLKLGLAAGGAALIGTNKASGQVVCDPTATEVVEQFPTSPLIGGVVDRRGKITGTVFTQDLPIPRALKPDFVGLQNLPGSGIWFDHPPSATNRDNRGGSAHQLWPSGLGSTLTGSTEADIRFYSLTLQEDGHQWTSLQALPINARGQAVTNPSNGVAGTQSLPQSRIWRFAGNSQSGSPAWPPMINAEYGKPCLLRFTNNLQATHTNSPNFPNFGSPDFTNITHLHNAHTAPESDGNPGHTPNAYGPGEWYDNLYLNWPAGGNDNEKQSFFWYHDHRMDFTSSNVYRGLVGIYPIYDSVKDAGDETNGSTLKLPGVRSNNSDGSFDVDYDVPLVFFDLRLDDGRTPHHDFHGGCGETHPEYWGKTFFKHYPDSGFVGDIFTVNGTAFPKLKVKRRKYRFRFLDASVSRIYNFRLMQGTVAPVPGQQGQYNFVNRTGKKALGTQVMQFTDIATDGGLRPSPLIRDSVEIWPAKRREVVIDFSKYQNGTNTRNGDVIYLANVLQMNDGRGPNEPGEPGFDPAFCVPVLKFEIDGDSAATDASVVPAVLRSLPARTLPVARRRTFIISKDNIGGEIMWLINGRPFDHTNPIAFPIQGTAEEWEFINNGGGWVHPIHIHQEEHFVVSRDGIPTGNNTDDFSKEDIIALGGGESVIVYRQFRSFKGRYVTHCHNLTHEDHSMMFVWEIV